MDLPDHHAEYEAKQDALVAAIPAGMIERYVPQIKILERQRGAANNFFFGIQNDEEISEFLNQSMEAHEKFCKENSEPDHYDVEAWGIWHEKSEQAAENFKKAHPEMTAILDRHAEKFAALCEPTNIAYDKLRENFLAEGCTNDQFEALRQAVLARKYSRPRPPLLPAPQP